MIQDYINIYGTPPPRLIEKLYHILLHEEKVGVPSPSIILMAPTGYGKSRSVPPIAYYLANNISCLGNRVIHVLPYRSVVEDLYLKTIEHFKDLNKSLKVGIQSMYVPIEIKLPFFLGDYIFTTLDSFVLNLFKISVGETGSEYPHYEIPRYAIYTSLAVFDEAHLFYSEGNFEDNNRKMNETFLTTLNILSRTIPIVILSATISSRRLDHIINALDSEVIYVLKLSNKDCEYNFGRVTYIDVFDMEFFNKMRMMSQSFSAKPDFVKGVESIPKIIEKKFDEGVKSILVVLNKLSHIGMIYNILSKFYDDDIIHLLHSYFRYKDKTEIIKKIGYRLEKSYKTILICSPIIEVGINLDFDYLITEASPISNIIQRLGRVLRNFDEKTYERRIGLSIIELGDYKGIYNLEYTLKTIEFLKRIDIPINWRLPTTNKESIAYTEVLNNLEDTILDESPRRDLALKNILMEIDISIDISGKMVRKLIKLMGGLVRDETLIPLYLPDEVVLQVESSTEIIKLKYDNLVPITASNLIRLIMKAQDILLRTRNGNYMYLTYDKDKYIISSVDFNELIYNLKNLDHSLFLSRVYLINPKYYDPKLGIYPILGV